MIDRAAIADKPTLFGSRVALVPLGPEHAEDAFAATEDPEGRRLTGTHRDFTLDVVQRWCETRAEQTDRIDLAVIDRATGGFAGDLALKDISFDNLSAGYRIGLTGGATGRGLGTEATRLVLAYAFERIGLHRVELEVYTFNPRAVACYRKCGFEIEGTLRHVLRWDGQWHDAYLMAALAPTAQRLRDGG
ncbi:GNAT family N-acetyltransferase [Allokutzneria sp. A3M-2-11 16]|uniref:GNAT family N-acetyltransferase n=1 Tax=Allokutzneria sp. A3M-2-11 16 TaxID=2962043 RepID=UPI0020B7A6C4|nr:GNAT family protein [Allokutzneria sp. A3M-2-11 16]MCP3801367.1 GNAT family N-acetyltransferase [Allokutzneria sp. A3M-2-11 16]